ncbi:MAG: type II toxin-antitoxin system VapC family toxin [Deltaproteobacteria bacterium]|nr:type II toxin-antitoxin system VapC family toxin [Deltaproteobacteria bacterium]
MKFWDTSAILPLLVEESASAQVDAVFKGDASLVVWWGTSIECVSAVARLEREGNITAEEGAAIIGRLNQIRETWREIQPGQRLKQIAERVLRLHPLRAQDAQQLAACLIANQDHAMVFVTLDKRLAMAAHKEGVTIHVWN